MYNIKISKSTIDNYKNNVNLLKELKLRMKSGSCNVYDMVLYNELVNEKDKVKKLNMSM